MGVWEAILLGVVQGLTEFLPVSSSGHLVLAQSLIPGFSQPGILFDVILHAGTLVAVILFFWKKIINLSLREVELLIIGTIPAGVAGILFAETFEKMFGDVRMVGFELIITGAICWATDLFKASEKKIGFKDSFLVGIGQAIAIIPGISRSGITILTGVGLGIDRKAAAEFSFLLSIPAIGGAVLVQMLKHGFDNNINVLDYSVGFLASFIFGILSIKFLLNMLVTKKFKYFGLYCFILGGFVILV